MSKKLKTSKKDFNKKAYTLVRKYADITEYVLQNGLTVLYKKIEGTGVVTTNITYRVGARDEQTGETGAAHMLEHMLFKPTTFDLKQKIDSSAMKFERETGCVLNANTWKDRTTYFFSYPKEYFARALQVEAERMHDVVLTDKEFLPERNNVLSEFDMNNGEPSFALSVQMICSAFHSHPYGHETIGFREDIERYTAKMLKDFYEKFYDPCNATLMIIGDISENEALDETVKHFGPLKTNGSVTRNIQVVEPKQEGQRRVTVERESNTNIVGFGVRHEAFPTKEWFEASLLSAILTDGPDSILNKKLVDTGLASKVEMIVEPTSEDNLGILFVSLTKKSTHGSIERKVFEIIASLKATELALQYKKIQQKVITNEIIGRGSSLSIAMELTEYVSAENTAAFFETEKILTSISAQDIVRRARELFTEKNTVIGHFVGKQ